MNAYHVYVNVMGEERPRCVPVKSEAPRLAIASALKQVEGELVAAKGDKARDRVVGCTAIRQPK